MLEVVTLKEHCGWNCPQFDLLSNGLSDNSQEGARMERMNRWVIARLTEYNLAKLPGDS